LQLLLERAQTFTDFSRERLRLPIARDRDGEICVEVGFDGETPRELDLAVLARFLGGTELVARERKLWSGVLGGAGSFGVGDARACGADLGRNRRLARITTRGAALVVAALVARRSTIVVSILGAVVRAAAKHRGTDEQQPR
jgi:hypothetical protein